MCGGEVPARAWACPECGAGERSAGRGDADDGGEDDFDYNEFVRDEFGSRIKPKHLPTLWWLTALAVLIALLILLVRHGGF